MTAPFPGQAGVTGEASGTMQTFAKPAFQPAAVVPIQVLAIDGYQANNGVKVVVYGGAGKGKTYLARSAPAPIILSAEGGLLSLNGAGLPMLPPITSIEQLNASYDWITTSPQARQFQTIVIDSMSEVCEVCLRQEKGKTNNGMKAYGEMADIIFFKLFRQFRDLPGKNVYFTAKEQQEMDAMGQRIYMPSAPGKQIQNEMAYFFDLIFRLHTFVDETTKSTQWWLQCHPDNNSVAKDRSGKLDRWEPANLTNVFNKVLS